MGELGAVGAVGRRVQVRDGQRPIRAQPQGRGQDVPPQVEVALEAALVRAQRQTDAAGVFEHEAREDRVAAVHRAEPVARDEVGAPAGGVDAVVEARVVQQPLQLVEVGAALRIQVQLLHQEQVDVHPLDGVGEPLEVRHHLFALHQHPVAEAVPEEVDAAATELDVPGGHPERARRTRRSRRLVGRAVDDVVRVELGVVGVAAQQERERQDAR